MLTTALFGLTELPLHKYQLDPVGANLRTVADIIYKSITEGGWPPSAAQRWPLSLDGQEQETGQHGIATWSAVRAGSAPANTISQGPA